MTKKELIKSLQYYSDDTDIMIAIPGPKKDSFYSSPQDEMNNFKNWLGESGIKYFRHLKGLKGTVVPVLKLNASKKVFQFIQYILEKE